MAAKGNAIFLDTSIQIARVIHSPATKRRIEEQIQNYNISTTSEVVRQEFKRRLLKEAKYLLEQLNRRGSFEEVFYHVERLPEFKKHNRKKHICLQMLGTLFDGASDEERTERAKLWMHYLLTLGLGEFDDRVDQVLKAAGCACSRIPIREIKPFARYEFGTDRCSETGKSCEIVEFLKVRTNQAQSIYELLKNLPEDKKTDEIRKSEVFLSRVFADPASALAQDPCLTVGDLIIALESAGIPTFYTINKRESRFFCPALSQQLIVRPIDPLKEDSVSCVDDDWENV